MNNLCKPTILNSEDPAYRERISTDVALGAPAHYLLSVKPYQIQVVEHTDIEHTALWFCAVPFCIEQFNSLFFHLFFLVLLFSFSPSSTGREPRVSSLVGGDTTTELYAQASFFLLSLFSLIFVHCQDLPVCDPGFICSSVDILPLRC